VTITIQVKTHGHSAKVEVTGHPPEILGPNTDRQFVAFPGRTVTVTEVETDTGGVHTNDGGGGGSGPPPK
jgi:hypothetical protein